MIKNEMKIVKVKELIISEAYEVGNGWEEVNKSFTIEEIRNLFNKYEQVNIAGRDYSEKSFILKYGVKRITKGIAKLNKNSEYVLIQNSVWEDIETEIFYHASTGDTLTIKTTVFRKTRQTRWFDLTLDIFKYDSVIEYMDKKTGIIRALNKLDLKKNIQIDRRNGLSEKEIKEKYREQIEAINKKTA